jgi:hypothetical protein
MTRAASMKLKGVILLRATKPDHVVWLAGHGTIKGSTHLVTLVPYKAGLAYIQGTLLLLLSFLPSHDPNPNPILIGSNGKV